MTLLWDVSQCHAATQQVCRGRVSFKTHCAADRQRGTSTKHRLTSLSALTTDRENIPTEREREKKKRWREGAEKEKRDAK